MGPTCLSFVERLSSFRGYFVQSVYTRVHLVCPLLGFFPLSEYPLSNVSLYTLCSPQDAVYKYNVQYAFITVAPIACKHYPL